MAVRIVFLDMDGTLLDSEKRLSPENRAALEQAAEKGVLIVPATGRLYNGLPDEVRRLPFVRYALCVNGAQVYDSLTGRTLHRAEIPLPLAMRVFRRLEELPVIYDCYLDGQSYISAAFYAQIDQYITNGPINRMVKSVRTPVDDFLGYLTQRGQSLQKIVMFFQDRDMPARARALESLPREFPEFAVTTAIYNNIEMNIAAAHKGAALAGLCRALGIGLDQAMAIGDGTNDLTMIQTAGIGVAMANADPAVLAAADYVTGSCDEHGVADAIRRFCL